MNKIINGKRYNTETAQSMGSYVYGTPGDFSYVREELYKKTTGEFFIYGFGGPLSKYGEKSAQNERRGGSRITPLSYVEAQDWVEKNLDGDDYESIFGPVDESGEKQTVAIRLTPAAISKVKTAAQEKGEPMSAVIEELIMSL